MPEYRTSRGEYGLRILIGGAPVSLWTYADRRVSDPVPLSLAGMESSVLRDVLWDIRLWMQHLERFGGVPGERPPPKNYRSETKDENGTIRFEFAIGGFSFEIVHDKATGLFDVNRTAFDLDWYGFKLFVDELQDFFALYLLVPIR